MNTIKLTAKIDTTEIDKAIEEAMGRMYDVTCPSCGSSVKVPTGKSACPKCGEEIDLQLDVKF